MVMKTVITDKRGEGVRPVLSAITDGNRLDWHACVASCAQHQAVHGQYGKPAAGSAFGIDQYRLASCKVLAHFRLDAPGLAAPPPDEQGAGLPGEPANDWPVANFGFGEKTQGGNASQHRDVRPADVVGYVECMAFTAMAVHPDLPTQTLACSPEAPGRPRVSVYGRRSKTVRYAEPGGQKAGACQEQRKHGQAQCQPYPAHSDSPSLCRLAQEMPAVATGQIAHFQQYQHVCTAEFGVPAGLTANFGAQPHVGPYQGRDIFHTILFGMCQVRQWT